MSETTDTVSKYESTDQGDVNESDIDTGSAQPASGAPEPLAPEIDNGAQGAPIPQATPQSPVQTESDTAETEDSPEVEEDNTPEQRSAKGNQEYREVKGESNL